MLEYKTEEWGYITLPNKMYELVKNSGDMVKTHTGYYTDAESEMLTILEYLNYGEKTNITEAMIEQIEKAVKDTTGMKLAIIDEEAPGISGNEFVSMFIKRVKQKIAVISYDGKTYRVDVYHPINKKETIFRDTLTLCRDFITSYGLVVRLPKGIKDNPSLVEMWF